MRQFNQDQKLVSLIDSQYFEGYSRKEIHQEMGRDRVRLESYQVALQQVSSGKTVVDVGAGNGVLSFYSYEAGA